MERGLIITCPEYDDATAYLTYFSREIIKEAEIKLLKVKKIEDKNLNFNDFSEILKKLNYRLIVLNGHGSADSIFGFKNKVILDSNINCSLLKEKIVYARACNAALILGQRSMENTEEGCFIGYKLPFIFYMDERWSTKPSNDNIAALFLKPSNSISIAIIHGHSAMESHENAKNQMLKTMKKLMEGKSEDVTPFYIEALWNNYIGQDIIGNGDAKLY